MTVTAVQASDYIAAAKGLNRNPLITIIDEEDQVDITDDGLGAYVLAQVWVPFTAAVATPTPENDDPLP